MIHLVKRYSIATALSAFVLMSGCEDDNENNVTPVTMQFKATSITTSESSEEQIITVPFSGAATANGTFEVTFSGETAEYGREFRTIPSAQDGKATVIVTKGQTAAQFRVIPVDNKLMNDVTAVTLTLSNPSNAFVVGSQSALTITMTDDEGPTKVNFATNETSLFENGEAVDLEVLLTSAATGAGTTVVSFTTPIGSAVYGTHFTTEPAAVAGKITLETEVGDEIETIKFIPVDNNNVNGYSEINFTIESTDKGVEKGVNLVHKVKLTDDETPSTATFNFASKLLPERKTDGFVVPVTLAPTLSKAGTLEITLTSATAVYGTHYTTDPAAVGGKITLNLAQGSTETAFTVLPVNNNIVNNDHQIKFEMSGSTGVVVIGSADNVFDLDVYDDDELTTIADLRALDTGSDLTLPTGTVIKGVVISKNDNVSSKDLHIQDATAGILVSLASDNTFVPGDELKVDLTGAVLGKSTGVTLAGKGSGVVSENAIKLGTAALPVYQTVTITELNTNLDAYESELVQIENAGFASADGVVTMNGSLSATNGTDEFIVRTETFSPWKDTVVPYGIGTIRGVATENNGVSHLLPQVFVDDIGVNVGSRLITLTQSIVHFLYVKKGNQSSAQQFVINGASLTSDLTITSPTYFMISKDNTTFSNSLTYTPVEAATDQTVYIKFAPNASTDQVFAGSVVIKSFGAASKTFAVNGIQGMIVDENFSYSGIDNDPITPLTAELWKRHSGANDPKFLATGLSYVGYPSATGGAVSIARTASGLNDGDINRQFVKTIDRTADIYVSFLINLSAASATQDYFLHFSNGPINTFNLRGKIFAKTNGAGWAIGLQKSTESRTDASTVLNFGQTYLVVLKYSYSNASDSDDTVKLFVYDSGVPSDESSGALITIPTQGAGTTGDLTDVGTIAIRQAGNGPTGIIDGVRIANNFADLFN